MRASRLGRAVFILAVLLTVIYVVGGLVGAIYSSSDPGYVAEGGGVFIAIWVVLTLGGALALLVGVATRGRSRWLAAALMAIGAVAGALPIFWTVVIPLAALALVILAILWAREPAQAAP